jgi:hypothetical protein
MKMGKYFNTLVTSTIRIAKAIQTNDIIKQFNFLCKNITDLSKNLQDFSKESDAELKKVTAGYYNYKTPIDNDINTNLINQINLATNLNNSAQTLIPISKQISNNQVTNALYLNVANMSEEFQKAILSLRYGFERYNLNKNAYSHNVDGKQLKQLINQLTVSLRELNHIATRFNNARK